ncbi:hypothetical protein HYC85_001065 [Camellia sinensis]|uniref:Monocopper oxidase-like protein SKS1 n=1 Tax=Camellia sinensis TaxID=4442 RepID=A0A7J7I5S0_CAMSI|nr:hypothetical protein HYC85_001065 [Camellia sinensis]
MALSVSYMLRLVHIALLFGLCFAADPFVNFELELSYITVSPLGVPQQVIAVNGTFPGPTFNVTTNDNVVMKISSLLGLECKCVVLLGKTVFWARTAPFLLIGTGPTSFKLRIRSRAAGGFGSFIITNRKIIPLPFSTPDGDINIMIGDWYTRNHTALRTDLDAGKDLGMPDGVLINGKGPYRYNTTLVPDGIDYETINVDPGKTYRIRVHNVGVSTCLNFRIQNHNLLLAETEGYYTSQQNYTSLDIHVGQSYSLLVTMDQNASSDYYIVASARFVNQSLWQSVTGVAVLHYSNSKGKAAGSLPDPPNDVYDTSFSLNQAMSIRQNVSASGARPNPQGSFHYGSINVTDVYMLRSLPPVVIDGKLRATFNGISFVNPDTPIRLCRQLDFPSQPLTGPPRTDRSVINATYKGFIEVILQNNDTVVQSFHMDGYSFFVVGMAYGEWTENNRNSYNKWDAIFRSTTQVFPGGWTAILVSLDNVGVWNLRAENLDRWYLGQETYMRIINPHEDNTTELDAPNNVLYCGALASMQKPQKTSTSASTVSGQPKLSLVLLMVLSAAISIL